MSSVNYNFPVASIKNVTVTAIIDIAVTDADSQTVLSEDFYRANSFDWTIVDDGDHNCPSIPLLKNLCSGILHRNRRHAFIKSLRRGAS